MIPALIVPVYGRWDLTRRMLDSIREPIARGIVADNRLDMPADFALPAGLVVARPPFESFGWGGTLNLGIEQMPDAPWYMWCTNDIVLGDDTIRRLWSAMADPAAPVVITHRWAIGAMTREVVARVGLFDTWSYHPIYFEDTDYAYRCHLSGVEVRIDDLDVTEGADGFEHSVTTQADPVIGAANNRTWQLNEQAYIRKWGGIPGDERYTTPWATQLPVWATRPDLDGRVARRWP